MNKSCLTMMTDLFERITKLTGEEDGVDIMYLGFSEAFDTVDHELLVAN